MFGTFAWETLGGILAWVPTSPPLLAALLLTAALSAQAPAEAPAQPARRAHLGRVLGPDGAPVAGASVTFLSGSDGLGSAADVVRVDARDNGRFRAQLLRGRDYRAYAVAPAGSLLDGSPVVSALSELGVPVTELRFAAGEVRAPSRVFKLRGLKPWRELGEIRVQLWLNGCQLPLEDEVVGSDGQVRVPPLPREELEAFVFVDGRLVRVERGGGGIEMTLPFVVRGRVVDADGAPVAGASIQRVYNSGALRGALPSRVDVRRFEVAQTDAAGRAEWLQAAFRDPFEADLGGGAVVFVASATGFRGCVAGFNQGASSNYEIITEPVAERTLPFVLERAEPLQVSFGRDIDASGIAWAASYRIPRSKGGYNTHCEVGVGDVVSSGEAALRPWPAGVEEPRVFLQGVTPRLAPDNPFARAVAPWLLEVPVAAEAAARVVVPQVVPVCVRVRNVDGGPASRVEVGLFSLERGLSKPFAVPAATDAAGRLVLPATPGRYLLVALGRRAWARAELEVAPAMEPVELRLETTAQMRLRVVDVEGRPLEGVRVGPYSSSARRPVDPLQVVLQELSSSFRVRYFRQYASARDGQLTLSLLPSEGERIQFYLRSDARSGAMLMSSGLVLSETEEFEEVVLQ